MWPDKVVGVILQDKTGETVQMAQFFMTFDGFLLTVRGVGLRPEPYFGENRPTGRGVGPGGPTEPLGPFCKRNEQTIHFVTFDEC